MQPGITILFTVTPFNTLPGVHLAKLPLQYLKLCLKTLITRMLFLGSVMLISVEMYRRIVISNPCRHLNCIEMAKK